MLWFSFVLLFFFCFLLASSYFRNRFSDLLFYHAQISHCIWHVSTIPQSNLCQRPFTSLTLPTCNVISLSHILTVISSYHFPHPIHHYYFLFFVSFIKYLNIGSSCWMIIEITRWQQIRKFWYHFRIIYLHCVVVCVCTNKHEAW